MTYRAKLAAAATAALALFPAAALAANGQSDQGGSPNQDSVTGGGENNPANGRINHFAISAHSDPANLSAWGEGHFVDTLSPPPVFRFGGNVICLRVVDNRAAVVFQTTQEKNQPIALDGGGDLMFLEDNGNPTGGTSPDRMINSRLTAAQIAQYSATGCPTPVPINPDRNLSSGNIVINDAP